MSELRFGTVVAVRDDYAVRVQFEDRDGIQSYWLRVLVAKSSQDKAYWPVDPGEHVACLVDENGENGVILGAVYGRNTPPSTDPDDFLIAFRDGGGLRHNRKTGDMSISTRGNLSLAAGGSVSLNGRSVVANGSPVARVGDKDDDGDTIVTGAG